MRLPQMLILQIQLDYKIRPASAKIQTQHTIHFIGIIGNTSNSGIVCTKIFYPKPKLDPMELGKNELLLLIVLYIPQSLNVLLTRRVIAVCV